MTKGGMPITPIFADGTPNGFALSNKANGGMPVTIVDDAGNPITLGGSTPPIIVTELPTTGTVGITYLVPSANPTPGNEYDEYIWTSAGAWELIGGSSGGTGGATTASQVSFDNANSTITATNVQVALEELDDEIQLARTMEVYTSENVTLEQVATEFPEHTFQNLEVKIDANNYYYDYVAPNSIILVLSGQFNFGVFSKAVFNRDIIEGESVSMMVYLINKETNQPIAQISGYWESGGAERRFDVAGLAYSNTANTECYVKISLQSSNPISVEVSEIELITSLSGIPNFTNTQAVQLANNTDESLSGTEYSQYGVNVENATALKEMKPKTDKIIIDGDGSKVLSNSGEYIVVNTNAPTALEVAYDNSTSGLSAINLQQAIDELDINDQNMLNELINLIDQRIAKVGGTMTGALRIEGVEAPLVTFPTRTIDGYRTFYAGIEKDSGGIERTIFEIFASEFGEWGGVEIKAVNPLDPTKNFYLAMYPSEPLKVKQNNGPYRNIAFQDEIATAANGGLRMTLKNQTTTELPSTGSLTTNIVNLVLTKNEIGATFSSNVITLPVGRYKLEGTLTVNKTGNTGKSAKVAIVSDGAIVLEGRKSVAWGTDTIGEHTYDFGGPIDVEGTPLSISLGVLASATGINYVTDAIVSGVVLHIYKLG